MPAIVAGIVIPKGLVVDVLPERIRLQATDYVPSSRFRLT